MPGNDCNAARITISNAGHTPGLVLSPGGARRLHWLLSGVLIPSNAWLPWNEREEKRLCRLVSTVLGLVVVYQ
jgi:hypothetical protein